MGLGIIITHVSKLETSTATSLAVSSKDNLPRRRRGWMLIRAAKFKSCGLFGIGTLLDNCIQLESPRSSVASQCEWPRISVHTSYRKKNTFVTFLLLSSSFISTIHSDSLIIWSCIKLILILTKNYLIFI